MSARLQAIALIVAIPVVIVLVAVIAGSGEEGDAGPGNPESAEVDYEEALAGAPPQLAALYAHDGELLDGGVRAYEAELERLRGVPVVVNKWASWCGPCRFEFPFFQELVAELGTEVAFLGINSNDSEDAARTFLEQLPVPYPSYADPEHEIGDRLENAREFPVTAFYDSAGELAYVHRGGYSSKRDVAADVERYAR